jgi:hypothetical protein
MNPVGVTRDGGYKRQHRSYASNCCIILVESYLNPHFLYETRRILPLLCLSMHQEAKCWPSDSSGSKNPMGEAKNEGIN